jgi:hypothetical protein
MLVDGRFPLPLASSSQPSPRFDLLRVPVIGSVLRWRYSRLLLQIPMLAVAVAVLVDGFVGPDVAPMNLAGVLIWVIWRGLLMLALLIGGNFFCAACPFLLPRTIARRFLPAGMRWPRLLRGKWLALGLLVVFFTSYEAFALWDSPRLTAWILVGYFAAAFLATFPRGSLATSSNPPFRRSQLRAVHWYSPFLSLTRFTLSQDDTGGFPKWLSRDFSVTSPRLR